MFSTSSPKNGLQLVTSCPFPRPLKVVLITEEASVYGKNFLQSSYVIQRPGVYPECPVAAAENIDAAAAAHHAGRPPCRFVAPWSASFTVCRGSDTLWPRRRGSERGSCHPSLQVSSLSNSWGRCASSFHGGQPTSRWLLTRCCRGWSSDLRKGSIMAK